MQQPLLPCCLSWSTSTGSTDSSFSCTPSWPSVIRDPGENSLAQAASAVINFSLKAGGEAAPLQSCCVPGQQELSPGTVERKVAALMVEEAMCWGGWMHRGKGAAGKLHLSHTPQMHGYRVAGMALGHWGQVWPL